jgi:hypothetical protein
VPQKPEILSELLLVLCQGLLGQLLDLLPLD